MHKKDLWCDPLKVFNAEMKTAIASQYLDTEYS